MEQIEGKTLTNKRGKQVMFKFELIPSYMKWMSSQSGELKNYATDFHLSMLIKQKKGTISGFIGGPKATNHTKVANDEVVVSSCRSDNIPSSLSNSCTVVKQLSETAD